MRSIKTYVNADYDVGSRITKTKSKTRVIKVSIISNNRITYVDLLFSRLAFSMYLQQSGSNNISERHSALHYLQIIKIETL